MPAFKMSVGNYFLFSTMTGLRTLCMLISFGRDLTNRKHAYQIRAVQTRSDRVLTSMTYMP